MSELDFSAGLPGAQGNRPPSAPSAQNLLTGQGATAAPLTGYHGRRPDVVDVNIDDYDNTGIGAFVHGAADTITFGYLDEAGAWVDSRPHEWFGAEGPSYNEALTRNRAILGRYEEDHGGAYLAGQVTGGFVPLVGTGGRARASLAAIRTGRAASIGRMTLEGAAYGALYGTGSADGDFGDRIRNGIYMGALGGAGSFLLGTTILRGGALLANGTRRVAVAIRNGRSPRLDVKWKPRNANVAEHVAEDVESLRRSETRATPRPAENRATPTPSPARQVVNRLTGRNSDELERGAVASADELVTPAARETIMQRIAKLTPQEARVAAQNLQKAMETGELTKDPHFRSILGIDLSAYGDEAEVAVHAAEMFHEMSKELLEKAGMGKRTVAGMEQQLRREFADGFSEAHLDDLIERTRAAEGGANVGSMVQVLAGMKFARVTRDLLPEVVKGNKEARAQLADQLSEALRISAKGQYLLSAAGRNLGMLKHSRKLLFTEVADSAEVESAKVIAQRVNAAFDQLGDNGLNELLSRVRDLSNLEEVSQVLLDPARAKQVGLWMRTRNTFEAFIKSNTLTPMTAAINLVGAPLHYVLRNPAARRMAAATARLEGRAREAMIYELSNEAGNAVRWRAHLEGIKAGVSRIRWEALHDIEKVFGVLGAQRVRLWASSSRQALIAKGYRPPPVREFDQKARLAVTNLDGFEARLAERAASDAPLARLVNGMERVGAAALNTVDALGTVTAKLASGVIDDYGRAMVMTREVFASSAARATEEALARNVPEDELVKWVSKRTQELVDLPPEDILSGIEAKIMQGADLDETDKFLLRRDHDLEKEADRVLFLDGPQTAGGRTMASAAGLLDSAVGGGQLKGMLFPYIGTPIRIMERGLASYTPWGARTKEVAEILERGGPAAALERARMEVGGMIIGIGMMASASGVLTVTNGGYKNSANLTGEPPNRINIGDAYVEIGRLEPLAMTLALGGIIGQMQRAAQEAGGEYGHEEALSAAFTTAWMAVRDAIFEKSYMTGVNDLLEALTSDKYEGVEDYGAKLYGDAIARVLPLSGTSRQINETLHGDAIEAVSFMDRLAKVTPGMGGYLPTRVDPLGNNVEGRFMGLAAGTTSDTDPLTMRLVEMGVNLTDLRKADPAGFDLTSDELSELRRIRGNEAVNRQGFTMREALTGLLDDPSFQALPTKQQKQDAITEVMGQFNEDARSIFEGRNQSYLSNRAANRSLSQYIAGGFAPADAEAYVRDEMRQSGLPEPDRLRRF